MNNNRMERDQELAAQMDIDATLDVVASKELLHRSLDDEAEAVHDSAVVSKQVVARKENLVDALEDESDAVKESSTVSKRLSTAKKKNAERVRANTKANDKESEVSGDLTVARKQRLKTEEELNKQQPLVDFASLLNGLNAELVKKRKKQVEQSEEEVKSSDKSKTTYDKYHKQAQREHDTRIGLFRRINKSLKKTARTSESNTTRLGANAIMGAGGFISDKIDDFMKEIPFAGTAYKGAKFVREKTQGARDVKGKRMVRERAHELRTADTQSTIPNVVPSEFSEKKREKEKVKEESRKKSDKKDTDSRLDQMIDVLKEIRTAQVIGTMFNVFSNIASGVVGGIANMGRAIAVGLGGLAAAVGGMSAMMGGLGKLKGMFKTGVDMPDVDTPDTKGNGKGKPSSKAPKPSRPESTQAESGKGAKGGKSGNPAKTAGKVADKAKDKWIKRLALMAGEKFATRAAVAVGANAVPIIGQLASGAMIAYTAYEVGDAVIDELGGMDAVKESLSGVVDDAKSQFSKLSNWFGGDDSNGSAMISGASEMGSSDPDGVGITDTRNNIGSGDSFKPEPGERFVSRAFDEVDKMNESNTRRTVDETIAKSASATAGAITAMSGGSTTINNFGGGGGIPRSSEIPAFGNEYQTPYQKGSMIQR